MDKRRINSSRMRTARFSGHIHWGDVCLWVQRGCLSLGQGVCLWVWGVSASHYSLDSEADIPLDPYVAPLDPEADIVLVQEANTPSENQRQPPLPNPLILGPGSLPHPFHHTPPPLNKINQTGVKILPSRNFACGG